MQEYFNFAAINKRMHDPYRFRRLCAGVVVAITAIPLGYPAACLVQHGWNPAAWPSDLPLTPIIWFHEFSVLVISTYVSMLNGVSPAFAGGGIIEFWAILSATIFVVTII